MGRKKKEETYIKSVRVSKDVKDFLDSLDAQNRFINNCITDTEQYKEYLNFKRLKDEAPSLF